MVALFLARRLYYCGCEKDCARELPGVRVHHPFQGTMCVLAFVLMRESFGSCWGGVHQFCLSMDNILRSLESLSRTELVWLNTYLVGRLRALPPDNDTYPTVPGMESPGSVAMQGPDGVTSLQEAAGSAQGLRHKAGRLTSARRWCRFRAISN